MWHDFRAELIVQARRPAHWLLAAAGLGLTVTFGYLIPFSAKDSGPFGTPQLEAMLPASSHGAAIGGMPVFVGSLAVIFGVLVVGSDYGWDTWKTLLVQQPSRLSALAGKIAVLAAGTLLLTLILLGGTAAASATIAHLESTAAQWPPLLEVLRAAGAGWLIAFTWSMLGAALSVLLRGVALPIGIGLVWMLAVQNLITTLAAPLIPWLDAAQQWLPGPAAGSLVAGLTGRTDTPGVAELAGVGQCVAVLAVYSVLFTLFCVIRLTRRDMT